LRADKDAQEHRCRLVPDKDAQEQRRHLLPGKNANKQKKHQDMGRARKAGSRFARDDKEPGSSWGKQLPGKRPRETA
jgi:hypothetical protein